MNQGVVAETMKGRSCAQMKFHTRYYYCRAKLDVTLPDAPPAPATTSIREASHRLHVIRG